MEENQAETRFMEENQAGKTVESSLEAIKDWCFASFCTYTFLCACKTISLTHELNQSPFAYTCFPAVLLLFGDRSLLPLLQTNNHSSLRDAHGSCTLLWPKMSTFWAGLAAKTRPRGTGRFWFDWGFLFKVGLVWLKCWPDQKMQKQKSNRPLAT